MDPRLDRVLDGLERRYGKGKRAGAADPYDLLITATCGYPASEAACARGRAALEARVGTSPEAILAARERDLVDAMRAGGIVPETRAARLREIARVVRDELGGDLRGALDGPVARAVKRLKTFPTIADAGAERILLLSRIAPVLALPSNALQVPLRLGWGEEARSWSTSYRSAQHALAPHVPEAFAPRLRLYRLLRVHGETICKRSKPRCDACPVAADCPSAPPLPP